MDEAIHITRTAVRELQKLEWQDLHRVEEILQRLRRGDYRNAKALEGFDKLVRTRVGSLRIVWCRADARILVVKVAPRSIVYPTLGKLLPGGGGEEIDYEAADFENGDLEALKQAPVYQWQQRPSGGWRQFVYGGYRYSPVLSEDQESMYDSFLAAMQAQTRLEACGSQRTWLVQSAPGTGKTVCAALFACRAHKDLNWSTTLLAPQKVIEDVCWYPEVDQERGRAEADGSFWLGTFRGWLERLAPELHQRLASPEEELSALRTAARHARGFDLGHLEIRDVLLYQAFVLDRGCQKDAARWVDESRVQLLRRIQPQWWQEALAGQLCRRDAAEALTSSPPPAPRCPGAVLIVDEAQDFLLAELRALISVREAWERQGVPTCIGLLGDLNQRIQPTGFHWHQLPLGKRSELKKNYRNSRHILEFAAPFLDFACQQSRDHGGRKLPPAADPADAAEEGEPVRLLEFPSRAEALGFLEDLAQKTERAEENRYLLQALATQVKLLWPHPEGSRTDMVILDAQQAKGREFESCVAFLLFENRGESSLEESFRWYTMLTRARSRLLVVATREELDRVGRQYFAACQPAEPRSAASWVKAMASDVDVNSLAAKPEARLLDACRQGRPYRDSYEVLQLAGIPLELWEREAMEELAPHFRGQPEALRAELEQTEDVALRVLLLRAAGASWRAVEEAAQIQQREPEEYHRLLEAIARDLEEDRRLPYEAARVRARLGQPWPGNYPFPELAGQPGSLAALLSRAVLSRSLPEGEVI